MRTPRSPLAACLAAVLLFQAPGPAGADAPTIAAPWNGEYFDKTQGGAYLRIALQDFAASAQTKYLTGNIQVTLLDLLKKKTYLISHTPQDVTSLPREFWKLPSGKYELRSIMMVDAAGARRTYTVPSVKARHTFSVKRHCLSNMGVWTISPSGKEGLALRVEMAPNVYSESKRTGDSSVAAVIDGITGLMQEKVGGKKVLEKAESNFEADGEMRISAVFTRQISMFFKLDLLRHNNHAQAIANVLQVYDAPMRRCYMDRLEMNDALRGDVKFTFLLSKATGTMAKLKNTGGSANDPKLAQCLYYELAQIQFPVPENMIGELTYIYDVR